uniref:Ferroptosis suppressor protein 1 n=1 Tax=Gouania willdenowi TaxID=441366 RepID=A0A8C5GZ77_GOUWI
MGGGASLQLSHVHVVVVGGGFGGVATAQQFKAKGVKFTLIDTRDAFHHNPGALRAGVTAGFAKRTFIPFFETFGDSFVQGRVQSIDVEKQTVSLDDGQEIQYTHLVLSTGTDGPFPGKVHVRDMGCYRQRLKLCKPVAAESVLVVGGGSTGVEMAAEIKTEYLTKKVILVHSREDVADPELQPHVRNQAKQVLLEKGVELLLGQKVCGLSELKMNVTVKNQTITTDRGTVISVDLVICCTGLRINSSAYRTSSMADDGSLKVNEHLQVQGLSNVFAVGDCAALKEPKMAYHAGLHTAIAFNNINGRVGNRPVTMLLAMGCDDGVGQFSGFALPRTLVAWTKSRDLLLWKSWRDMGQKEGEEQMEDRGQ